MAPSPLTSGGSVGTYASAFATMSGWIALSGFVSRPIAVSTITSAASLPARMAPSIEPRNFCDVQSPASTKFEMGVSCDGRYLLRPGIAA